jgi:hypothetical protein
MRAVSEKNLLLLKIRVSVIETYTHYYGDHIREHEIHDTCRTHREIRKAYTILSEIPEGKRTFGRPRCRWEDNINVYPKEIGYVVVNYVKTVMSLGAP